MALRKDQLETLFTVTDSIRECKKCQIFTKKKLSLLLQGINLIKNKLKINKLKTLENEQSTVA